MLENRPWTYQTDIFCVAATVYTILFGKYMDIEQRPSVGWCITNKIPRYLQPLWNTFFSTLLNIRDCDLLPNLQELRTMFKEQITLKEKLVREKIIEFNSAISQ